MFEFNCVISLLNQVSDGNLNNTGSNSPEDKPTWDYWGNDKISCTFHRKINSDGKWDFLWESGASVEPGLSIPVWQVAECIPRLRVKVSMVSLQDPSSTPHNMNSCGSFQNMPSPLANVKKLLPHPSLS